MPQMAPLPWLSLLILVTMGLIIFMTMLHYSPVTKVSSELQGKRELIWSW